MRQLGAGRKLGRYTLLRRIASGGMAEVYAARSHGVSGFEKKVAIKKILPQYSTNERFVDMLVDEAKIAVTLSHPNIAQIYELGLEDETYYIVMEFVDGRPLNRLLQKVDARGHRTIPIEHAVHVVAEVSKGLYHAHEQRDHRGQKLGIVHRDVSPQNVMIAYTGDVKLIDFGIARAEGRAAQTNVGTIKGKLRYLAPEIALGLEPDHRVDVYCCGIVLFELLTGEALYAPRTDVEAIEMASQARTRSPRLANPQVPVELEDIVMRALVRDRDHRYPSAKALSNDLRRFLNTYAPAFVGNELGDYMQALFGNEVDEDRRLDGLAEKVILENGPNSIAPPAFRPSLPPQPIAAEVPPATNTQSGGYREIVSRTEIPLDRTPALISLDPPPSGTQALTVLAGQTTAGLADAPALGTVLLDDKSVLRAPAPPPGKAPALLVAGVLVLGGIFGWALMRADPNSGPIAPVAPLPADAVPAGEMGGLMVEVSPNVAIDVTIDGVLIIERAMPPVKLEVPVTDAPQSIVLTAPGYAPHEQLRKLVKGNQILITAALDPLVSHILLTGLDPGAKVVSDSGQVEGDMITGVELGSTVTVRVQRRGMVDWVSKVQIDKAEGVQLDIGRAVVVPRGTLRVASYPYSDVYINDRNYGRTPVETQLPVGKYRVMLKREGKPAVRRTADVAAGKQSEVVHTW